MPQTVIARQLANPFLAPDFSAVAPRPARPPTGSAAGSCSTPLFRAFEYGGDATCMPLPEPDDVVHGIRGLELMHHQAQVVAAAAAGHRTFLLADEPGLGKTAQALLAADAADAFPLLVVVPNVVKANWAHEAELWTPRRTATVIHGDGETIDGFADIVIVNYEILDRHVGWLGRPRLPRHGRRRGALHQEQVLAALAARPGAVRADPGPQRQGAAHGAHRHPAHQRHRGLQGDLAVPRLDRREEAATAP